MEFKTIRESAAVTINNILYEDVSIRMGKYSVTNQNGIIVIDNKTESAIAVASIAQPEIQLEKDEVIIKDYSENEGTFQTLMNNEIIEDTGKRIPTGYAISPIGRILNYDQF